jgi:hypothetical protein
MANSVHLRPDGPVRPSKAVFSLEWSMTNSDHVLGVARQVKMDVVVLLLLVVDNKPQRFLTRELLVGFDVQHPCVGVWDQVVRGRDSPSGIEGLVCDCADVVCANSDAVDGAFGSRPLGKYPRGPLRDLSFAAVCDRLQIPLRSTHGLRLLDHI